MPLCPPELSGWAGRILENLPEPNYSSTGSIVSYLQYNLPDLNRRIYTDFYLSGECILPEMSAMQSGIYEALFRCQYLTKRAAANLGTASFEWVEIESHDQGRIRRVAQTTVAQGYRVEAKACNDSLNEWIAWYNQQQYNFGSSVGMVIYRDRGPNDCPLPAFGECIPCWDYFSTCNSVIGGYYLV